MIGTIGTTGTSNTSPITPTATVESGTPRQARRSVDELTEPRSFSAMNLTRASAKILGLVWAATAASVAYGQTGGATLLPLPDIYAPSVYGLRNAPQPAGLLGVEPIPADARPTRVPNVYDGWATSAASYRPNQPQPQPVSSPRYRPTESLAQSVSSPTYLPAGLALESADWLSSQAGAIDGTIPDSDCGDGPPSGPCAPCARCAADPAGTAACSGCSWARSRQPILDLGAVEQQLQPGAEHAGR